MNGLTRKLQSPLLTIAGFSFAMNLLTLVPSLFMLQVFDRVLTSRSADTLLVLMMGTGLALLLMLALDYLRSRLLGVSGNLAGEMLAPVVVRQAIAQGARRQGKAGQDGLRDVGAVRALFSSQGVIALFDAPWVIVYVAFIWLAHPALGVTAAVAALLMLALAALNDRLTRRPIESIQRAGSGAQRRLEGALANAEVAQAMGMTDALINRWRNENGKVQRLQRRTSGRSVGMAALTRTFRQVVQVLMLAVGAWLVIAGQATGGVMIATTILLSRALAPVEQVVGSWRVLAEGRAAWQRLLKLLLQAAAEPVPMPLPAPAGHLQVSGLVYRAPGSDRLLLGGVGFTLAAGESLAIVGPSGAGKSTLVRALIGILPPSAGTVRLDGVDLSMWNREEVGPFIGYVPQDVELFEGSVAENIARLGQVNSDRVLAAAKAAGVHEMILQLPRGYETMIDPQGSLMSPGQRQRLALARALYGGPSLIVLDEPNSNLDGAGEAALAETLKALKGKATVIVVTHRATLTRHVDKMLALEAGRVAHFGSPPEVAQALQAAAARAAGGAQVLQMSRAPANPAVQAAAAAPHPVQQGGLGR